MNSQKKLLALFGPAGAGKDTIQRLCYDMGLNPIVSCTTRPPREGEINGISYYFKTKEEFEKEIAEGGYLEYTQFRGWYYGTSKDSLTDEIINVGVFNIQGIESLLKHKDIKVIPILIQVNEKERLLRQLKREKNPDCMEICRRFQTDAADFANIPFEYETISNESDFCYTDMAISRLVKTI